MRKLHLVGLTTDRDGLIFTARKGSKSGGYIVPLDGAVLAAVAEVQAARNGAAVEAEPAEVEAVPRRPRHQSALTPREMQARLRAGRTIEEVAAEAGVDNDWVARFAVPILAEQAQVVELARTLVYAKPRLGESSLPLGASVSMNLTERGVFLPDDVADAGWSAFQLHDSVWLVRFRYRSRGRSQEAQWEVDLPAARLHARNRHASDLGYVDAGGRRKAAVVVDEEPAAEEAPSRPARARATPAAKAGPVSPAARTATAARAGRAGKAASAARAVKKTPAKAAKRPTATKRATAATGPTAARAAKAAKAGKTTKAGKTGKTGKATSPRARQPGAAKAAKSAPAAGRATAAPRASGARSAGGGAPAKEAGRAPAKRRAAPEPAPPTGSGGVRSAVAQVSAARVSASLASAERTPWAAAVRRPAGARLAPHNGRESWPGAEAAARPEQDRPGREFQPRPLPAGGEPPRSEPVPRVRKVSSNRSQPAAEPKPVSLPAPRQPVPRTEPIPVERVKRRRLRSR